jgi:SNF2 family DNA or RNA helicase
MQNDLKLLIFAHHQDVLDGIETEVRKLKIKFVRIDGKIAPNKRYEQVKLF